MTTIFSLLVLAAPALADWSVTSDSSVGFVSIKNNAIGENNAFTRVAGYRCRGQYQRQSGLKLGRDWRWYSQRAPTGHVVRGGHVPGSHCYRQTVRGSARQAHLGWAEYGNVRGHCRSARKQAKKMAALSVAASNGQAQVRTSRSCCLLQSLVSGVVSQRSSRSQDSMRSAAPSQ